ncbi:hypothetical protein SEVIR_7G309850v4 [Setaria viridis]|uniref:Uncharacterized protein n=1 Tax=Setaria viridis TaxID=4556 RepID=A0A4V6D4R4_SETVI|nr:uncharacterized protein LOC111257864 [Setaria italica]TKW07476.1 hypothetical protein SEVIR_7G309850v2 [Setaria viridis]
MKSAMSLCLLLWRQLVNLWRNRRGHEEGCCYYISRYCTVQNPIITHLQENGKCVIYPSHVALALLVCRVLPDLLSLGLQVPKRQSKSYTEMGNKIKIGPAPEIPFSNFQQVRESGLNFDQDSRSSPAYPA